MKKILVLLTTLLLSSHGLSAIKPSSQSLKVNDLYFNYQWPLENSGHVVVGDVDDITPYETHGVNWAHVDWDIELDSQFKQDTVVAIIDSGVDIEHEDLKGRIYLNEKECRDGRIPLGPTGDPDQNGFEGDCAGWNFATKDVRRQRMVDDDVGHGTHVAGIIAANVNNGIGLAGLSNRIKILPLKVYDSREGQMPAGTLDVISLRVARAIDYAIHRKVDVINLSLGWPIVANIQEVKDALNRAEAAGIIVVAAAGNDRHEAQIYPCAFKSVFCVGSINVNGVMSRFSNFGGQVDILAPGGQILGLIPMTLSSDFFGMKGYDIKFGTSQAAPFVAAAAAILKGIFPQITNEEVRSALMSSARPISQEASAIEVFSSSGLLQIKKAVKSLQEKNALLARPVFKEFDRVVLDESSLSTQICLPVINGKNLTHEDVTVTSQSPGVQIRGNYGREGIDLKISVDDQWVDAIAKFSVRIKNKSYLHQVLLVKNIKNKKSVYSVSTPGLIQKLQTVPNPTAADVAPRFFYFDTENKKLSIYSLEEGKVYKKIEINIFEVDFLLEGIGIQRVDIDLDGRLDYWVSAVVADEEGRAKELRYLFFNDEGELINQNLHQSGAQSLALSFEYALPIPAQSRFIRLNDPAFGDFYSPLFLSYGPLESVDQSKDVFDPNRELVGVHLNYLWPQVVRGQVTWVARSLTHSKFQKKLRSQLSLASWAKFELLTLRLPEESVTGEVSLLMSTGSGIVQDYFHLHLSAEDFNAISVMSDLKITPFKNNLDFSNQMFDAAWVLDDEDGLSRQTMLKGQFARDRLRSLLLGQDSVDSVFSYKTQDPKEFIGSLIKEFHLRDKSVRFFELDTTLEVVTQRKNRTEVFSAPIYRTSFVQGSTFSLRFNPMFTRNENKELAPSLYVDHSALFSPTFYMWQATDEKVYVPVKHSFEIPELCQAMNPLLHEKESYAVLFCKGHNGTDSIELVAF